MQITVEDLSSVKKILHIEIPENKVVGELNKVYDELKKTSKIKGFRPGKVPRSVLERLFKKKVHSDVSSSLIQDSLIEAIKEKGLKVVGSPEINPSELDEKTSYKYDATVEIKPEIEKIDFDNLNLKKTLYQVSNEEIDIQLKMLQKNLAQKKVIEEDRPIQKGDFALIDYEGFKDGKPFAETQKTENFTLKIGDGSILKEFDEQLIGIKPGNSKEIKVVFPKDHLNDKLANLEITFQVVLKEIREEILPEIDDEFAKKLGTHKSLDELKKTITNNLEQGYVKRAEQELNEQIFTALIAKTDFEVPDSIINYELENIIADAEKSFTYHNTSMEQLGLTKESLSEQYRDTAEQQAKRHLVLEKIIEQEKLTISDEDMEEGFKNMAKTYNHPIEEIKNYYKQNNDKIEFFQQALLEKKAVKLIIEKSIIEEVKPEQKV